MASEVIEPGSRQAPALGWRVGLWVAQVLLAALFGMAGGFKVFTPADQLLATMHDAPIPLALARFIGTAELAGAVGVILPAATRILPVLTPVAACGLTTVMVLATGFNLLHGQTGAAAFTVAIALVAALVAWGRFKLAPIQPR